MTRFPYLLALTLALGGADHLRAQIVLGQVADATNGTPLEAVRLQLFDLDGRVVGRAESGPDGGFELRARQGGLYSVGAESLGYLTFRSDPVSVPEDGSISVRVRLGVDAIPLSPFVVIADSQLRRGRTGEFERRRSDPTVGGHFLDASDIESRPMATPSELLRALPAVDLYRVMTEDNRLGLSRHLIYLPGSRGGSLRPGMCLAQVFVNGIAVRQSQDGDFTVDDYLAGVPLTGVEVYTRASAAPLEYRATGECGVVLYWTQEPTSSSGAWGLKRIAVGVGVIVGVLLAGFLG